METAVKHDQWRKKKQKIEDQPHSRLQGQREEKQPVVPPVGLLWDNCEIATELLRV